MSKTPEQMAEEYAETVWDESELAPEDRAIERHVAIGKHSTKIGFLAGYQAAKEQLLAQEKEIVEMMKKDMQKTMNDIVEVVLFPKSELHDEHFKRGPWADMIERSKNVKPKENGDLLHQAANEYLDRKAAKYRRVCGYKK